MGELLSVDSPTRALVVRESTKVRSTKEITVRWDEATRFAMGAAGASSSDLSVGDTVKLTYTPGNGGRNLATSVAIIKAQKK